MSSSSLLQEGVNRGADLGICSLGSGRSSYEDEILAGMDGGEVGAHCLTQAPLHAVAHMRFAHTLAHRKTYLYVGRARRHAI